MSERKPEDSRLSLIEGHWRLGVAALVGVAAFVGCGSIPPLAEHRLLASWDLGALTYIVLMWSLFLKAEEQDIRNRAARQDESAGVVLLLVLAAIVASLGAIVAAMLAAKDDPGQAVLTTVFVASTLVLGWVMMLTLFVPHYAHRHFAITRTNPDAGFGFTGEGPTSYLDFVYIAFTVGATFQVSDNTVGSTRLRNLITAHGAAAYVYNTAVLAVGINLLAGFVSG